MKNDSRIARNIWADTIEKYHQTNKAKWYDMPDNVVGTLVEPISGKPTDNNKKATMFYYIKGTEPGYDESLDVLIPTLNKNN